MNEPELSPHQLISIFNWLHKKDLRGVRIETPWCPRPVAEMVLNRSTPTAKLSITSSQSDLAELACRENADPDVVRTSLVASGILAPDGWKDLTRELDEIKSRNILRGDRPRRIVLDTVALNRRYYTVIENHASLMSNVAEGGWGIGYLAISGILQELAHYDRKYQVSHVQDMMNASKVSWFDFGTFTNQLMMKDRQFRLGDVEGKKMCASGRCMRASCPPGDGEIIKAIGKHSHFNQEDILAVSEDSDFVSKCKNYEIRALRLDRPRVPTQPITARWKNICDLIYVLSVVLGVVRLTLESDHFITAVGIWKGKKEESWNQERIRVESDLPDLSKWLADSVSIMA